MFESTDGGGGNGGCQGLPDIVRIQADSYTQRLPLVAAQNHQRTCLERDHLFIGKQQQYNMKKHIIEIKQNIASALSLTKIDLKGFVLPCRSLRVLDSLLPI